MDNPMPQGTISQGTGPLPPHPMYRGGCHSDAHILFGIGVVLLIFGGAITGYHQANLIGLGLIIFSNFLD